MHPTLLDAVLHPLVPEAADSASDDGTIRLPFSFSGFALHAVGATVLRVRWTHVPARTPPVSRSPTAPAPRWRRSRSVALRPIARDRLAVAGPADRVPVRGGLGGRPRGRAGRRPALGQDRRGPLRRPRRARRRRRRRNRRTGFVVLGERQLAAGAPTTYWTGPTPRRRAASTRCAPGWPPRSSRRAVSSSSYRTARCTRPRSSASSAPRRPSSPAGSSSSTWTRAVPAAARRAGLRRARSGGTGRRVARAPSDACPGRRRGHRGRSGPGGHGPGDRAPWAPWDWLVARRLVTRHGARHLLLVSRRGE